MLFPSWHRRHPCPSLMFNVRTYVRTYVRRLRRSSSDAIFFDVRAPPVPRTPLFRAIAPQRARMQANAPFCNACIWDQSRLSNTYVHTFTHSPVFTARISSTGFKCASRIRTYPIRATTPHSYNYTELYSTPFMPLLKYAFTKLASALCTVIA